jgi:hypothetical protein
MGEFRAWQSGLGIMATAESGDSDRAVVARGDQRPGGHSKQSFQIWAMNRYFVDFRKQYERESLSVGPEAQLFDIKPNLEFQSRSNGR